MKTYHILFLIGSLQVGLASAGSPSGEVVWWGYNWGGATSGVYEGSTSTGIVATASGAVRGVVAVASSESHSLALKDDGTVFGWGWNHSGQVLGFGTPFPGRYATNGLVRIGGRVLSNVVAVAAGDFSLALRRDGTVVTWGRNTVPPGLSNVIAIAAGGFFSIALKSDGTVVSWSNLPDCETHVPVGLSNVVAVAAASGVSFERSMALKRDGTVVEWESGERDGGLVPAGLSNVVAIAAGGVHNLALMRDGRVFGWGFNPDGEATGIPTTEGSQNSSGLVTLNGQILTNVVAIAAWAGYSLALRSDGTVVAWGERRGYSDVPRGLSGVVDIAAGKGFCLTVTTNGSSLTVKK